MNDLYYPVHRRMKACMGIRQKGGFKEECVKREMV